MAKKPPSKSKKQSFDELQAKWYKKLADSGFEDMEDSQGRMKNAWQAYRIAKTPIEKIQAKQQYYSAAEHFLNTYDFDSEIHRVIWEYHTHGISVRDIAKLLTDAKVMDTERNEVWRIIHRLEVIMKRMFMTGHREYHE